MMVSGEISKRRLMSFLSQPARGGSRMTVWLGSMKERQSSDLARKAFAREPAFFANSAKAALLDSTRVRCRSEATERPIVPTPA